jgi:hypothetical protein
MKVIQTKNFFVNSENPPPNSECRDVVISIPQGVISCNQNEHIRVTLGAFSMRQSFYTINKYNNVFYLVVYDSNTLAVKSAKITIPEGNYQAFDPQLILILDVEIGKAMTAVGLAPAIAPKWYYNILTGRLELRVNTTDIDDGDIADMKLVAFTIKDYNSGSGSVIQQIIGSDTLSAFQDSHEILGGCRETRNIVTGANTEVQFNNLKSLFSVERVGGGAFPDNPDEFRLNAYYQASLSTKENVYLRTDLQSNNVQTSGFDTGSSGYPFVVNSQILAKIPFGNQPSTFVKDTTPATGTPPTGGPIGYYYQSGYNLINYIDNGNNLYSMRLSSKNITSLRLTLTDGLGRLIPEQSKEQIDCNALYFTATIRIDIMTDE